MLKIIPKLLTPSMLCVFVSCGLAQSRSVHEEKIQTFLQRVKEGDFTAANSMVWKNEVIDSFTDNFNLNKLRDLVNRYGIPNSGKWKIEYDTAYMVKRETFTIPFYQGYDKANKLKDADVEIDFEYKGQHIGNLIFGYTVNTLYDR